MRSLRLIRNNLFCLVLVWLLLNGITVARAQTPVITTSTVTGSILGCVGSAGESPNIAKFTLAGTGLHGDITVTPPTGFDISLTAVGGYSPTLVLKQAGGAVITTTIYVRSSASDPVGPVSGNIQISTPGTTSDLVAVSGFIHALATADPVQNFVYNNGDLTVPINFTGLANTFTIANNNPTIGYPATGQGNISSFNAINNGNTPVTATFTVTPSYAPVAYIANSFSSDVSLVLTNTLTQAVTPATINLGQGPWGVSLSPDYSKVYVTNGISGTVSVINTSNNAVTATIPVGSSPEGVLVSKDGTRVYVANEMSGTVSVINASNNTVMATIQVGNSPTQIAASPDGSLIYVSNYEPQGYVSVISTITNTVVATIGSLAFPAGVAISLDGSKLYVASNTQNAVTVINTANYSVITTIPVGSVSTGLAISPDGSHLYVTNSGAASVSVINTATNTVSATIGVGKTPAGICVSPDGSIVWVVCAGSNLIVFINTSTNDASSSSPAGNLPLSFGNFVMPAASCPGTPITFTITVNPSPPSIKTSTASGTILACGGTPSASPDIEQFSVSASALTGDLTIAAPAGFEISFVPGSGFTGSLTIPQVAGAVKELTIYVRSLASDAGSITGNAILGNITLSSPGAADQKVAVTGTIYAGPTMNPVSNQTVASGQATTAINFTGPAKTYTWTNDTPGIGLGASGTGDIPSFTAINPGPNPVTATITVTPRSAIGCNGTPVTFTITVDPPPPPVIGSTGTLTGLTTIYGTASSSESFTISATNTSAGILVTPPPGFEVSSDNINFSPTVTVGSAGTVNSAPVYIRLSAATPAGNNYSGNVVLSTPGAGDIDVNMPASVVNPAPLTITANNQSKPQGAPNPDLTVTYTGFVNGDGPDQLTTPPVVSTDAATDSPVGTYPITVTGGDSPNYTILDVPGTLTVSPSLQYVTIPNAFTPNGDGVNDYWNIPELADYPNCMVSVYTRYGSLVFQSRGYGKPWDGTSKGSPVPVGTYYYVIDARLDGQPLLSGYVAVLR